MNTSLNRDRFIKVLSLAESGNDHEALAAVRKAAIMARSAGLSLGQAVGNGTGADTATAFRAAMAEACLSSARSRIADLERQLAAGANETRLDQAHAKGYQRGHAAGRAAIELEVRMEANRRIREVEAELEAFRPALDWVQLAERFAFKNQRGPKVGFARAVNLRARTNKLTPNDQAELRKFAESGRGGKGKAPDLSKSDTAPTERPRSAGERRQAVLDLLTNPDTATLSDREIARRVGVSASTVGALRRKLNTPT
ncbi:MAG: hypothetical protein WCF85_16290 [Rhodospirillaceae bacterium]